jgi:rhodanese-related sulfurtransferase
MGFKNLLIASICSIGLLTACSNNPGQTDLSVTDFENAIGVSDAQVLDVRTAEEYQSGHLKNSLLANWNNEDEFKTRAQSLNKNKPVYTYCLSGARSAAATEWLNENGYKAFNLSGGIIAWKRAGKPLEQAEAVKQITMDEYLAQIPMDKTVLVDFSAVWCPPCKIMTPVIDSLVGTNGTRFTLVRVDGGQQTNICTQLKVDAFPTFIIYKQGKESWRKQGIVAAKELIANF